MRVLVTGASGGVGSSVVALLQDSGVDVRGVSRTPRDMPSPTVDVYAGDLTRPETLSPALDGVDGVFLYSFPDTDHLPGLISVLRSAGVTKVVVLSTIDTTRDEPFVEYNRGRHLAVENAVVDGGFSYVCLRPGAFASNSVRFWGNQIRAERRVRLPFPESQQAPIADIDIAAVAVRSLVSDDLDGRRIVLTGPESLTMRQQVGVISAVIDEPIVVEEIPDAEARALYGRVLTPAYLDLLMGQWAFEVGERAVVTTAVADVVGRAPVDFRSWVQAHRALFT